MFDESHGWFPHYGQAIVRRLCFFFRRPTARNNLIYVNEPAFTVVKKRDSTASISPTPRQWHRFFLKCQITNNYNYQIRKLETGRGYGFLSQVIGQFLCIGWCMTFASRLVHGSKLYTCIWYVWFWPLVLSSVFLFTPTSTEFLLAEACRSRLAAVSGIQRCICIWSSRSPSRFCLSTASALWRLIACETQSGVDAVESTENNSRQPWKYSRETSQSTILGLKFKESFWAHCR